MESGTKLGHYEISTLLGKGGMGEVWRAKDTKLGREVAIKTLPEEFSTFSFHTEMHALSIRKLGGRRC